MTDLLIAATEANARAAEDVETHHAAMAGELRVLTERLVHAGPRAPEADAARRDLVAWCERELLPHATAEERDLYPAARSLDGGRFLVDVLIGEHEDIVRLVRAISETDGLVSATAAVALKAIVEAHLAEEDDLLLPLLANAPGVSLADLVAGIREPLDGAGDVNAVGCAGHSCACGEADPPGHPELDARTIPHAIRHATIFGALESIQPGAGLVLVAPHDPLPLLTQVEQRWPGAFAVDYLERGPEAWRLDFLRA
jgi:uncharacterized protein (DUF2249 family)